LQPAATGTGFTTPVCEGAKHQATIDVAPSPFTPGDAAATAGVFSNGVFANDQATVKVQ
jgi:hypothetical protein